MSVPVALLQLKNTFKRRYLKCTSVRPRWFTEEFENCHYVFWVSGLESSKGKIRLSLLHLTYQAWNLVSSILQYKNASKYLMYSLMYSKPSYLCVEA